MFKRCAAVLIAGAALNIAPLPRNPMPLHLRLHQPPKPQPASPYLGIIIDQNASAWTGKGLVVQTVIEGTTAHEMGIQVGDRVLTIGESTITSTDDLKKAVDMIGTGNPISVSLERGARGAAERWNYKAHSSPYRRKKPS